MSVSGSCCGWVGRLSAFGLGSKICGHFSHSAGGRFAAL